MRIGHVYSFDHKLTQQKNEQGKVRKKRSRSKDL